MHSNQSFEKILSKKKYSFAESQERVYNHKKKGKTHSRNKREEFDYEQ
jgi:hypothetical protein